MESSEWGRGGEGRAKGAGGGGTEGTEGRSFQSVCLPDCWSVCLSFLSSLIPRCFFPTHPLPPRTPSSPQPQHPNPHSTHNKIILSTDRARKPKSNI